ncbi:MAG: ROK family protein [Acidimicrobiales bacterium]
MPYRIGVDVGGTKCLGVVIDDAGEIVTSDRRPTPRGATQLVDTVSELATTLANDVATDETVDSIGVGLPGSITCDGVLTSSPHLPGVVNFDASTRFSERLGRTVKVGNDASCSALAEWRVGAGRGVDDMIMITLGTGIGGGVIAGGRLLLGANGYLGEFGHIVIDLDGPLCPCGKRGCWERYASGSAIALEAKRLVAAEGRLGAVVASAGSVDDITSEHIVAAALDGDGDAAVVLEHFARWMAVGLGSLMNAFDPAMFVIGGGLSRAAHVYEDVLRARFAEAVYASDLRPLPVLAFAVLGERAGAVGAAMYGAKGAGD